MESSLVVSQRSQASSYALDKSQTTDVVKGRSVVSSSLESENSLVLKNIPSDDNDTISLSETDIITGLSITAQKIQEKLRELLNGASPQMKALGFNPEKENVTSEDTAETVVHGIALLFERFRSQNPSLGAEELLKEFMDRARSGVEQGYSDAYDTLKGLGAFDVNGVQSAVEETKTLIDKKLKEFEKAKRKELGLAIEEETTETQATTPPSYRGASPVTTVPANVPDVSQAATRSLNLVA